MDNKIIIPTEPQGERTDEILKRIERLVMVGIKNVLNVSECAVMLGISESRVRHLTASREIPHYKQGKSVYFKRSEVEEWMTNCKIQSNKEISRQATMYTITK